MKSSSILLNISAPCICSHSELFGREGGDDTVFLNTRSTSVINRIRQPPPAQRFGRGREHTFLQQGYEKCWRQELCHRHLQLGSCGAKEPGRQGTGETGSWGNGDLGSQRSGEPGSRRTGAPVNWGARELGSQGARELGSQGAGELGSQGPGELGSRGVGLPSPSAGQQGEERKSVCCWEKRAAGNSASDKDTWEQQGKNRSANPE